MVCILAKGSGDYASPAYHDHPPQRLLQNFPDTTRGSRFHTPLIEPDMQIYRIRLSDKTSRLHPRRAATKPCQPCEPEVPVKVREWIAPALASSDLVLGSEPPTQPHGCVVVERAIRFDGGANTEVISPSAKREAQLIHKPCR